LPTTPTPGRLALSARVSSADQKGDLERQIQRLRDYAAARGSAVAARAKEVSEVASGRYAHRPKLVTLLTDPTIGTLGGEHPDRLTRFGYEYIRQLLETQGRHLEVLFPTDRDAELVDDFVAVLTNMAARLYGRRNAKRRAAQIQACVRQCGEQAEAMEATGEA